MNVGVSGYTAGQVLAEQVPQIGPFQPTLITFQAGGNDIVNGVSVDEYRQNVRAVLDPAKASGARVIVLAQNEWFRSPEGQNHGTDLSAQRDTHDTVLIEEASAPGTSTAVGRRRHPSDAGGLRGVGVGARIRCIRALQVAISQLNLSSATLVRLPTQATLLPRIRRGRT